MSQQSLKIEIWKKTVGVKCTQCEKTLKNRAELTSHIKKTHNQNKSKCNKCKQSFTTIAELVKHSSIHLEFRCKESTYSSDSQDSLSKHIKQIHKCLTMTNFIEITKPTVGTEI